MSLKAEGLIFECRHCMLHTKGVEDFITHIKKSHDLELYQHLYEKGIDKIYKEDNNGVLLEIFEKLEDGELIIEIDKPRDGRLGYTTISRRSILFLLLEKKLEFGNFTKDDILTSIKISRAVVSEYFAYKFNVSSEEGVKMAKERQATTSKASFIKRYGNEEGEKKYLEHFDNIHSKTTGHTPYTTLNYYKEKYGDVGEEKHKELLTRMVPTKQNFIRLYGEQEGIERYAKFCTKRANTLENFKLRHGEQGLVKYQEYREKASGKRNKATKESLLVLKPLYDFCKELGLNMDKINLGIEEIREFYIYDKDIDKTYAYDFVIRDHKLIIEYNGTTYHPNPEWIDNNPHRWENWREPYSKMTANEKYAYDKKKVEYIQKYGFIVLEIWSDDDMKYNIEMGKKFILDNLKKDVLW